VYHTSCQSKLSLLQTGKQAGIYKQTILLTVKRKFFKALYNIIIIKDYDVLQSTSYSLIGILETGA
jgi:hypothetical protein